MSSPAGSPTLASRPTGDFAKAGASQGWQRQWAQHQSGGAWALLTQEPSGHPPRVPSNVLEEQGAGRQEALSLLLVPCVTRGQPAPFPRRDGQEIRVADAWRSYQLLSTY